MKNNKNAPSRYLLCAGLWCYEGIFSVSSQDQANIHSRHLCKNTWLYR